MFIITKFRGRISCLIKDSKYTFSLINRMEEFLVLIKLMKILTFTVILGTDIFNIYLKNNVKHI